MHCSSDYYKILRLQEEGRSLLRQWTSEKKELSKEDPLHSEIDQNIAKVSAGILQLEDTLLSIEQARKEVDSKRVLSVDRNRRRQSSDSVSGMLCGLQSLFQ